MTGPRGEGPHLWQEIGDANFAALETLLPASGDEGYDRKCNALFVLQESLRALMRDEPVRVALAAEARANAELADLRARLRIFERALADARNNLTPAGELLSSVRDGEPWDSQLTIDACRGWAIAQNKLRFIAEALAAETAGIDGD